MKNNKNNDHSFSYEKTAFALIWIGVIIIVFATVIFSFEDSKLFFKDHFGDYGEYIGGFVGSLWALAGVALFYEALRFQRTELKMQRHELELQRHEIVEQTAQYRKQNETLLVQTFENTFFQLMLLHNEIVSSIHMEVTDHDVEKGEIKQTVNGRDCFVEYYRIYKRFFHASFEEVRYDQLDEEMSKELINSSYTLFFEASQANLGHYFRNFQAIIKFIDKSELKRREFYIDLIKAQLSNFELILIYFHCISVLGKNIKPLIEKYSMFAHIPDDELVRITKYIYDEKAFKSVN